MSDGMVQRDFVKSKVVFVEGRDEVSVINSITLATKNREIQACDVGGKEQLIVQFPLAIKQSSFANVKSMGIIQDADNDPSAAFERVKGLLKQHGFPLPRRPGDVVNDGKRDIKVLILPSFTRPGYLEDLFLDANAGAKELDCVNHFSACCAAAGRAELDSKHKALGVLLALGVPETRLGRAFDRGTINANSPAYDILREFIATL